VESGFIHPEFAPDQMPLTVLFKDGESVDIAEFDPNEVSQLFEKADSIA
jgi:hypothetical protein